MDKDELADVSNEAQDSPDVASVYSQEHLGIVTEPLREFTAQLAETYKPTAPVKFPNREQLTVRLVNISVLQRLDEVRSDSSILQNILWAIIGSILGFVTNVFTSSQPLDRQSWIFLGMLATVGATFVFLCIRASKRSQLLRKELFDDKPPSADQI